MASLSSLPTELLITIFSHLDYFTLKLSVTPTCRRFRYIIISNASSSLSRNLFRDLVGACPYASPALHPALSRLCFRTPTSSFAIENIGFHSRQNRDNFIPLKDHPVATESATSPARASVLTAVAYNDQHGRGRLKVRSMQEPMYAPRVLDIAELWMMTAAIYLYVYNRTLVKVGRIGACVEKGVVVMEIAFLRSKWLSIQEQAKFKRSLWADRLKRALRR